MFKAIADRTRRATIERLARGPAAVSDLAAPFDIALPSVMQHLDILTAAGLVQSQKIGRIRTFQLVPGALNAVATWAGAGERLLDGVGDLRLTQESVRASAGVTHLSYRVSGV